MEQAVSHRLRLDSIAEAARVVDKVFLSTPQFVSEPLSKVLGARVVVKVETLNPVRCFKLCGGNLTPEQMARWLGPEPA